MTIDEMLKGMPIDVKITAFEGLILFRLLDIIGRQMVEEDKMAYLDEISAIADFIVSLDEEFEKAGIKIIDEDEAKETLEQMKNILNNQNG